MPLRRVGRSVRPSQVPAHVTAPPAATSVPGSVARSSPASAAPGASPRRWGTSGQAAVEFALALPIVVLFTLGLLMVGIAVRNELAVELAAREGARAASVSADPGAAQAAADRAVDLPVAVDVVDDGTTVTVTATYTDPGGVAVLGSVIGPTTHTATVTMHIEPP